MEDVQVSFIRNKNNELICEYCETHIPLKKFGTYKTIKYNFIS